MSSADRVAGDWRLRGQRYRLEGEVCGGCRQVIFPPRDICPRCGEYVAPPVSSGYVDKINRRSGIDAKIASHRQN